MDGAMTAPARALEGCCTNLSWLAVPVTLVRLNIAEGEMPDAVAVTWNEPTCVLAVAEMEATPALSVVTAVDPANVTLAPLPGAAKVTVTLGTPLPSVSCTRAFNALAYGAPTAADCPVPATTVMLDDVAGLITKEVLVAKRVPSVACSA